MIPLFADIWAGVPYPPARLYWTLGFMLGVVAAAILVVRRRFARQLLSELATTLGAFLVIIGAIVYTAAFRGLRPLEMVVAWLLSVLAIVWFVGRLNRTLMRAPLRDVGLLIEETQRTAGAVLSASSAVTTIGGAAAEGARQVTQSLARL